VFDETRKIVAGDFPPLLTLNFCQERERENSEWNNDETSSIARFDQTSLPFGKHSKPSADSTPSTS
jgi:hypothetical protein